MAIHVVRLGSARSPQEGLRLGTVRRPPRGVRKSEYAARDFFDLWLPELAPSAALASWALAESFTGKRWAKFVTRYRSEMRDPRAVRLRALLVALSRQTDFAVGCYCADANHCHRAILADLLEVEGADVIRENPVANAQRIRKRSIKSSRNSV